MSREVRTTAEQRRGLGFNLRRNVYEWVSPPCYNARHVVSYVRYYTTFSVFHLSSCREEERLNSELLSECFVGTELKKEWTMRL